MASVIRNISISENSNPSFCAKKETLRFQRTRKDRNHGFGLSKIKEVLEKYEGRYEMYMEEDMVTIKVYLPI